MATEKWGFDLVHSSIDFWVLEAGGILVGDKVEIDIEVEAVKSKAGVGEGT